MIQEMNLMVTNINQRFMQSLKKLFTRKAIIGKTNIHKYFVLNNVYVHVTNKRGHFDPACLKMFVLTPK